jgi:hypothetical protein
MKGRALRRVLFYGLPGRACAGTRPAFRGNPNIHLHTAVNNRILFIFTM